MTSFPVVCIFAVVKMASSENFLVSKRSQAYILRKLGFKVSHIMEIMIRSKNWVIKWSVRGKTEPLEKHAYVILQIVGVFVVVLLLKMASSFF